MQVLEVRKIRINYVLNNSFVYLSIQDENLIINLSNCS